MLLKCLFCIVLYITESFTLNETTTNLVNATDTSTVTSAPNKDEWVPRVVNGAPAKLGEVPYQVALKKLLEGDIYMTFCGGAIISNKKVLSAAHCFAEIIKSNKTQAGNFNYYMLIDENLLINKCAVAGSLLNKDKYTSSHKQAQWRTLLTVRYPEEFNFPNYDIAVVYTRKPFIYTDYVAPIPIPSKDLEYNGSCLISGYGRTSHDKKDAISSILLTAQLELINQSTCSILQLSQNNGFVCTNTQTSDVAKGDSGGPLVCKDTGDPYENSKGLLVGVISGHVTSSYSFFSKVSKYLDFIKDDFVSFAPKRPIRGPPRKRKNSSACTLKPLYPLLVLPFVHTYMMCVYTSCL